MSKTKTLLALALATTAVVGVARWRSAAPADKGQRVVDRIWIDHMPKTETDKVAVFIALSEDVAGAEMGLFNRTSMWAGEHEMFTYRSQRGALVATFPQTGETETITATGRHCDEGEMDFCLELSGTSRGVKRYYSRKGWEIDAHTTPAEIDARVAEIERAALP